MNPDIRASGRHRHVKGPDDGGHRRRLAPSGVSQRSPMRLRHHKSRHLNARHCRTRHSTRRCVGVFGDAKQCGVDFRRLELLVDLARLESMRAVAEVHGLANSTVSQQIAALAREVGVPIIEPNGRLVRLTPAGRCLVGHAVEILALVEAARRDSDPLAEPAGRVRVGGFAVGIRVSLLPILANLAESNAALQVVINEYAPAESLALLIDNALDLALIYDFALSPIVLPPTLQAKPLWSTLWGLGVSSDASGTRADLRDFADQPWIVSSGTSTDENVVRTLASVVGFTPVIGHRIECRDLVEDLIIAGHGVALLPMSRSARRGLKILPIRGPIVEFTTYAVWRRGAIGGALRRILDQLAPEGAAVAHLDHWPRRT
ncbi:LysR family transcriptional regulator [Mycolicibacterium sp. P9-64]|uniref:LysR family transcriptional regulator n=1 Tax=Mycolicibacterium sp. P9-64 TaxID=2024612 RepID=UPI0032216618